MKYSYLIVMLACIASGTCMVVAGWGLFSVFPFLVAAFYEE